MNKYYRLADTLVDLSKVMFVNNIQKGIVNQVGTFKGINFEGVLCYYISFYLINVKNPIWVLAHIDDGTQEAVDISNKILNDFNIAILTYETKRGLNGN